MCVLHMFVSLGLPGRHWIHTSLSQFSNVFVLRFVLVISTPMDLHYNWSHIVIAWTFCPSCARSLGIRYNLPASWCQNQHLEKKAIISSFRNLKPVVLYVLQYLARGQSPHVHEKKRPEFHVSDSESKLQPACQCENHHIEKKAIISSFSTPKPGVSYVNISIMDGVHTSTKKLP